MTLLVNQLIGFGAFDAAVVRTLGSKLTVSSQIGDMIANAGLAAAFDGTTSQAIADCCVGESFPGWVGANFSSSAKRIYEARISGSNDQGYFGFAINPSTTIYLRGSNGSSPSAYNEGTLLGSITFTDTANESSLRTITSSDKETTWKYVWAAIEHASGSPGGVACAELELYEAV